MFEIVISYFFVYSIILGSVVVLGLFLNFQKERNYFSGQSLISTEDVVVIIPFRNEAHRIETVIQSINTLKSLPTEFIFVNDHSDDNSNEIIKNKLKIENYRILDLPEDLTGKKAGIRYGIVNSDSQFILTTDADVVFNDNYFDYISKLENAEMYLMPVTMKAKKAFGELYEIDLILVNAVNVGLAGLRRPIMASGANLLFKRESFVKFDTYLSHKHISSGDDMYLLRDFRENKADVRLISNPLVGIETETPQSFKEFIDQRLRWLGKTGNLKDHLSTSLTIFQTILTSVFFTLVLYYLIIGEFEFVFIVLGLKAGIDLILFWPYFYRIQRMKTWLFIPIYEILFPFYTLLILGLIFVYKPKWKSREIYLNK